MDFECEVRPKRQRSACKVESRFPFPSEAALRQHRLESQSKTFKQAAVNTAALASTIHSLLSKTSHAPMTSLDGASETRAPVLDECCSSLTDSSTEDDFNLTSTHQLSEFLLGLEHEETSSYLLPSGSSCVQRVQSFASLQGLEVNIDGSSVDEGSDDTDGSFSNDSAVLFGFSNAGSSATAARKDGSRKEWAIWEDEAIRNGVHKLGLRWRAIAAELPGRSDDAVRNRWARMQQSVCGTKQPPVPRVKRDGAEQRQSWSEEEDRIISSSVYEYGHRWNRIAERLPRRTEHAIRNRWHRLQMRTQEAQTLGSNDHEDEGAGDLSDTSADTELPNSVPIAIDRMAPTNALRSRSLDVAEIEAQSFFSSGFSSGFDFDAILATA